MRNSFEGTAYPSDLIKIYNEEYATVNERIARIIEDCCFDILFITDISPRDEKVISALNELSKTKTIRLVDHHDTSESRFAGWTVGLLPEANAALWRFIIR